MKHLPIWRDATQLLVQVESAVRLFPRYHKYTLGTIHTETEHTIEGHPPHNPTHFVSTAKSVAHTPKRRHHLRLAHKAGRVLV
jgi:hypothetical protein